MTVCMLSQWARCSVRETLCFKWIKCRARQRDMSMESRGLALSCTCLGWGRGAVVRQRKPPQNSASQAVTFQDDTKPWHYGLGFLGSLSSQQRMWSYTGPQQQLFLPSAPVTPEKQCHPLPHEKYKMLVWPSSYSPPPLIQSLVCTESYNLDVAGQGQILSGK